MPIAITVNSFLLQGVKLSAGHEPCFSRWA